MTLAVTNKRVKFVKPFFLEGLQGEQPSGTYRVETRNERTGFFALFKAKQTSTWIRVCRNYGIGGILQIVNVDSLDLANALERAVIMATGTLIQPDSGYPCASIRRLRSQKLSCVIRIFLVYAATFVKTADMNV